MSCEGCDTSAAAMERQRAQTRLNAKSYAIEKKKNVIIYFDPVEGFKFMEQDKALELGLAPVEYILYA